MRVRHKTEDGRDLEITIQTRQVTTATIRDRSRGMGGKTVASGFAVLNPKDDDDPLLAVKIALGRAFDSPVNRYSPFENAKALVKAVFQKYKKKDDNALMKELDEQFARTKEVMGQLYDVFPDAVKRLGFQLDPEVAKLHEWDKIKDYIKTLPTQVSPVMDWANNRLFPPVPKSIGVDDIGTYTGKPSPLPWVR